MATVMTGGYCLAHLRVRVFSWMDIQHGTASLSLLPLLWHSAAVNEHPRPAASRPFRATLGRLAGFQLARWPLYKRHVLRGGNDYRLIAPRPSGPQMWPRPQPSDRQRDIRMTPAGTLCCHLARLWRVTSTCGTHIVHACVQGCNCVTLA